MRFLNPQRKTGPWTILCDGEALLRAKGSLVAYRSKRIVLWAVPAKGPELNPVEMFWGWLRQKLRTLDLHDLRRFRRTCQGVVGRMGGAADN